MTITTRRRTVAAAAALALTAGLAAALGATTAQADTAVTEGELDWGFRASFRQYVANQTAAVPPLGAAPVGERITVTAPAAFDADGAPTAVGSPESRPYTFPVSGENVTATDLNVQTQGGVTYNFPSHTFRISFADPNIVVSGATKQVLADVTVVTVDGTGAATGTTTTEDVAIADVATVNTTIAGDGLSATIAGSGVTLSTAGAAALNGYLNAGDPLDDFAASVTLEDPAAPAGPTVQVSKSVANPAGDTITVTGSGFDPASSIGNRQPLSGQQSGAYVVFGKFAPTWKINEGAAAAARKTMTATQGGLKWALPTDKHATVGGANSGAIELTPEGTFSTTLNVQRDFAATGMPVDGVYGVYTYPGSTNDLSTTANWDFQTFTPITFAAPTATSPSQGAVVEPGDPVSVSGTGFNAGETVDVVLHSTPTDIGDLTADANGDVSGSVTIPAGTEFGAHELHLVGTVSGVDVLAATFTVGSTDVTAQQTITTEVSEVGALSMSIPSNAPVVLGTPELSADILSLETDGAINPVHVTDTRIADPGWTVTGILSDFAGPEVVDGAALNWEPNVLASDLATGQTVVVGPAAGDLTGLGATLATGTAGSGRGSAQLGADIDLVLPTTVEPGTYTATLTLTAV